MTSLLASILFIAQPQITMPTQTVPYEQPIKLPPKQPLNFPERLSIVHRKPNGGGNAYPKDRRKHRRTKR